MLVSQLSQLHDVGLHHGLPAADGKPVWSSPQGGQDFVPFIEGQLVLALHPDVTGEAPRIALRRRRKRQIERQHRGPTDSAVQLEQRDTYQHAGHRLHPDTYVPLAVGEGTSSCLVVVAISQMLWLRRRL